MYICIYMSFPRRLGSGFLHSPRHENMLVPARIRTNPSTSALFQETGLYTGSGKAST